jgi:2'-5' RNA ligase
MTERRLDQWVTPRLTPHLTLLRDKLRVAEQAIEPIAWIVHEFVLVHSARGANGRTEHVALARWPMRG